MTLASYGEIAVTQCELDDRINVSPQLVDAGDHLYCWHPEWRLPDLKGRSVEFGCKTGGDGTRRFYPVGGSSVLMRRAFMAHLAIVEQERALSPVEWNRLLTMQRLYELGLHVQQRFKRLFKYKADLTVPHFQSDPLLQPDVLPEGIGTTHGKGKRWSLNEFLKRGREAAQADRVERPTLKHAIEYGIYEAAKLDPCALSDHDVAAHIRAALFDQVASGETIDPEVRGKVFERFQLLLNKHRDNKRTYDDLIAGKNANIFKRIAEMSGDKLDVIIVRRAVLDLVWEAYLALTATTAAFMRCFCECLPVPLNSIERVLFEATYFPQAYLGGLSLTLLADRPFIRIPILRLWEDPADSVTIGVLHRSLAFYREMVLNRRDADNAKPRKDQAAAKRGGVAAELALEFASASSGSSAMSEALVKAVISHLGVKCPRCLGRVQGSLSDSQAGKTVKFSFVCDRRHRTVRSFPWNQIVAIADDLVLPDN